MLVATAGDAFAVTTIGVDLPTVPNNNTTCGGGGCTIANASPGTAPAAAGGFTAPSAGVIVRWRVRTSAVEQETGPVDAVFRVIAGNHGAGSSAPVVLADADAIQEFPTRIPIAGGSRLGRDLGGGDFLGTVNAGSATRDTWNPLLPDGITVSPISEPDVPLIPLNADLEPDTDGDGFGDESQDQCPGEAGPSSGCLPPDSDPPQTTIAKTPPNKSKKPKAKFKFTADEAGSTFECSLKRPGLDRLLKQFSACRSPRNYKRLDRGKFKFKVRAIDAAGNVDPTPAKDKFKVLD